MLDVNVIYIFVATDPDHSVAVAVEHSISVYIGRIFLIGVPVFVVALVRLLLFLLLNIGSFLLVRLEPSQCSSGSQLPASLTLSDSRFASQWARSVDLQTESLIFILTECHTVLAELLLDPSISLLLPGQVLRACASTGFSFPGSAPICSSTKRQPFQLPAVQDPVPHDGAHVAQRPPATPKALTCVVFGPEGLHLLRI